MDPGGAGGATAMTAIVMKSVARALLVAAGLTSLPSAAPAQGVRVSGVTTASYVELRPFLSDSVPVADAPGEGTYRQTASGLVVRCSAGSAFCKYFRSASAVSATPMWQDVQATAWGFGQGVSLYAHLRARAEVGSELGFWPRADDRFDALAAYVELDRARFRVRAGRQWTTTGLGFYNFDGASLVVRPPGRVSVDVYGGWSLARGLNEPRTSGAIAAVEDLAPDDRGQILGAVVRLRPSAGAEVSGTYQREVRGDRASLLSERVALDGSLRVRTGGVDLSWEQDLATGFVNEARSRVRLPAWRRNALSLEARRYRPFFELWTIWGAFAPVGFDEARASLTLAPWLRGRLTVDAHGAWRRYDETGEGLAGVPMKDDGYRLGASAALRLADTWDASGGWSEDVGFGASRSDGDVALRWSPTPRLVLGARGSAFQSIYEFRVGTGRVYGLGLDGGLRLGTEGRLVGDVTLYRHRMTGAAPSPDWSQRRASLRLEWTIGADPGAAAAPKGREP